MPTKFDTKQEAEIHALSSYESDDFPGVSTGVVVIHKYWGAQARFMGLENGFSVNIEVARAGL
ncbi:hypothetical protein D3C85_1751070 [compost metagenome]